MFDLTVSNGLTALVLAMITYQATITLYNLTLHPLSHIPGPILWSTSHLPMLSSMLRGTLPQTIKSLHSIHGPIVRISPNELSVITPSAWKEIYLNKDFIRPLEWRGKPPGIVADNLISASVPDHARFRKGIASAFAERAVALQEGIVRGYVDLLIAKLHEKVGEGGAVDMVPWINFTTFDIISDLGWGTSFKGLEKQEYHPWVTVILQFKAILIGAALAHYPALNKLVGYITPKSALAGLELVIATSTENVRSRLQQKTERPNMMAYILSHNETSPETSMSEAEMITNSMAIIVAGSETITAALAGTINCLLSHPSEMATLLNEIRSAFSSETDISGQSTRALPYLTAVLQESMRLCPPIPDNMHRRVPQGGAIVAGHRLPEGVVVGIPCFSMFRSKDHFSAPDEFNPERWLQQAGDGASERFGNDRHGVYHPFSIGPHGCLGQQLAWLEMRVILARLLWNFNLEVPQGSRVLDWTSQKIFWAWEKEPVKVSLSKAKR